MKLHVVAAPILETFNLDPIFFTPQRSEVEVEEFESWRRRQEQESNIAGSYNSLLSYLGTYLLTLYSSLCSYQKIDTFSQQDNTFITFLAKSTSISQFSKDRKLMLRGWEINTLQSLLLEFFWLPCWSQNPDSFQIQKLYGASIASLWSIVCH